MPAVDRTSFDPCAYGKIGLARIKDIAHAAVIAVPVKELRHSYGSSSLLLISRSCTVISKNGCVDHISCGFTQMPDAAEPVCGIENNMGI